MGEIKSTLDIIMEKTKNLTLTPEEKEVLRREDWLKKTRGRIQKFLDGAIDLKRLKEETRTEERPPGAEGVLKEELVGELNPQGDNESRFLILKELFDTPIDPFREIVLEGQKRLEEEKRKKEPRTERTTEDQGNFRFGGPAEPCPRSRLAIRFPGISTKLPGKVSGPVITTCKKDCFLPRFPYCNRSNRQRRIISESL